MSNLSQPAAPPIAAASRFVPRCAALAWLCWLLSIGLLWIEHQLVVLHPYAVLFLSLFAGMALASLVCLVCGAWRTLRGPGRLRAWFWTAVGSVPLVFWTVLGMQTLRELEIQDRPKDWRRDIVNMFGASAMEAQAVYTYPHRQETEHLVMFYHDRVVRPAQDLQAMEEHVAGLVKLTGKPLREKIYWVRGELVGRSKMAVAGLALGTWLSHDPTRELHAYEPSNPILDRHELAHAVLNQHYSAQTDPPTLLIEGWAEAQSGQTSAQLADHAVHSRKLRQKRGDDKNESYLRELVGPTWYYQSAGPVYNVGGAFADYLIQNYGAAKFLDLYFSSRPGAVPETCTRVYGISFAELETIFWTHAEKLTAQPTTK